MVWNMAAEADQSWAGGAIFTSTVGGDQKQNKLVLKCLFSERLHQRSSDFFWMSCFYLDQQDRESAQAWSWNAINLQFLSLEIIQKPEFAVL